MPVQSETTREPLTRAGIAATALEIADREGLDAVTIRRLAQEHAVTPMALYWHFKDKDAVLDGIAERIFSDVKMPDPTDEQWDAQLQLILRAALDAVSPHPNASELLAPRVMTSDAGLMLAERVIGLLRSAGCSGPEATQISSLLLCSIVTLVTSKPADAEALDDEKVDQARRIKQARLSSLSPKQFPNLTESAEYFVVCASDDEYFTRGLDFLVSGARGVVRG
jgi:TetR/AcrR family transcriptional regulator, tetracycline repressor protein